MKKKKAPMKFDRGIRLCPVFVDVAPGETPKDCTFPNCSYLHDVKTYMESKPPDISETCYVFETHGHCPRGITCRFASGHIDDQYRNKGQKISASKTVNNLSKDLQNKLRKKTYDFEKSDKIVDEVFRLREEAEIEPKRMKIETEDDSGRRIRKKIDWSDKLYLAPLTTVGNLPFRRICKKLGADITCGEMAMGLQLLQGHLPEWALVQRHESEDIFGVQLCGNSPQQITRVAQLVEENVDCDFVDINLGCPIDLVYKRGMGAGLMARKKPLEVMIRSVVQVLSRPLTVKIRTGIYADKQLAHSLIPCLREWGTDMVTLHGRSREQRYTKTADWDYIAKCADVAKPMPLFGNGDVMDYETYNEIRAKRGVSGVMIARGALIKPWVFTEIKEQRHWDIKPSERLDIIKDYVNYGLEHWGSDDKGVETTRRFLLEWLSFLHRYVPKGVVPPSPHQQQKRVPPIIGQTDIETVLSSPDCKAWIQITEMFLGKVPENFQFEPRHKANAYNNG